MFSFHHIALSVSDIDTSVAFYKKLGFQSTERHDFEEDGFSMQWLQLGDVILELFYFDGHQPLPEFAKDTGTDLSVLGTKHFALRTKNIDEMYSLFQKEGIEIAKPLKTGRLGFKLCFIKDPDGILIEIVEV